MKRSLQIFIALALLPLFSPFLWGQTPYPTSLTVLTQDDFVGRPIFSIADALKDILSLNLERIGTQGTRAVAKIRGAPSEKNVTVLLDGNNLAHSYDNRVDLSQIPINIVDRIEISRGGGPVSLGAQGSAGTINIVTLRPEKKGITTRLGTGVGRDGVKHSHGQFRGRSNLGDLTYLGSVEESNGFMTNEDSKGTNHFVNLSRSFNGRGFWAAEYYYQESEVGLGQGTPVPFGDWNSDLEQESSEPFRLKKETHQHVKFTAMSPRIHNGAFNLQVTYRLRESDIFLNDGGPSIEDKANRTLDTQLKWQKKDYEIGIKRSHFSRSLFDTPNHKAFEDAFYAFNRFFWNQWTIVPGINAVHHSEAKSAIDPRLVVIFHPREALSFSATAQTAHRAPNFDELFTSPLTTASNPDLNYEKSHSYDLGASWAHSNNTSVKLTGFRIRTEDLITSNASNQLTNSGKEKISGVEAQFQLEVGDGTKYRHMRLDIQGTWQRSHQNGLRSPMTPTKFGSVSLSQFLPRKFTLTNTLRYQEKQWELAGGQGLKIPSYMVWDLRLGCKIHSADLYFEAQNLAGRHYADTYDVYTPLIGSRQSRLAPQPEQTFWAGLSIRFEN